MESLKAIIVEKLVLHDTGTERCDLSFYNFLRHNDFDVTKPMTP